MGSKAQTLPLTPDEEIVRRFHATGDAECFTELFVRHRKKVYAACRRFFGDSTAAEDATQEAFLRAFQAFRGFSGADCGGWLMRIARNVCIDLWRRRRRELGETAVEQVEASQARTLEHSTDLHFAAEKLREELCLLPEQQRVCLEMKMEGYSYEETATRTGLPIEAVKSHLQNGRRMLWMKMQGVLSQLK